MKDQLLKITEKVGHLEHNANELSRAFIVMCARLMGISPASINWECLQCHSHEDAIRWVEGFDRLLQCLGVKPEELRFHERTWADVRLWLFAGYVCTSVDEHLSAQELILALRWHLAK